MERSPGEDRIMLKIGGEISPRTISKYQSINAFIKVKYQQDGKIQLYKLLIKILMNRFANKINFYHLAEQPKLRNAKKRTSALRKLPKGFRFGEILISIWRSD